MTRLILAKRFAVFLATWLVLSRGAPEGLVFGIAAAAVAAWASLALMPPVLNGPTLLGLIRLVPGFVLRSFQGGIDVAHRALHPKMPLDPGWIVHRTTLPEGLPRVSFGAETSLLPGSLVAGARGDLVFVHCLDRRQDVAGDLSREEARIQATLKRSPGGPADA